MNAGKSLWDSFKNRVGIYDSQNKKNVDRVNVLSIYKSISIYIIVSLFLFFEMAVQVSPSVMATQLMHDLNISAFGLGLMSGVYFYTYTVMQLPSGFLLDRFSPRLIISLSILTCSIGSMLFACASNIYLASLARLLMGCGSAFAFVSVLVVTADLFKSKYFATLVGVTQMLAAFGAMAGQMPVGVLVSYCGWRKTMVILSVIGFVLTAIVCGVVNYKKNKSNDINIRSNIKNDLKEILSKPQTWYIALYSCLLWAPMSGFASLWGVPFLTNVGHLTQSESALLCSLMWLGLAVASPILGLISTAVKNRVYPLACAALIGAISFFLILEFNFPKLIIGILLFLAGAACSGQALSFAVIKENNLASVKATAIAFNNMAVVISGAIFQPLIGKFISENHMNGIMQYDPNNFRSGLLILFLSYVAAFLIAALLIKETKCISLQLAENDHSYACEVK